MIRDERFEQFYWHINPCDPNKLHILIPATINRQRNGRHIIVVKVSFIFCIILLRTNQKSLFFILFNKIHASPVKAYVWR